MQPENFDAAPPCVGLILDGTDLGNAAEALSQVTAELARFGLTATGPQVLTLESARPHAAAAAGRGWRALVVACADPALARALAAGTTLPVLRVPVPAPGHAADALGLLWPEPPGADASAGHATLAIGEAGARNAALFVVSMLALGDGELRERWRAFRRAQTETVLAATLPPP